MNTKHLLLLSSTENEYLLTSERPTAAAHPDQQIATMSKILHLFIICVVLQEGCGLSLADHTGVHIQVPHPNHIRTKRCSCNSWDDKECIYFCHLDIIWVNTPSNLLPYGLGSLMSRRRRSADRCKCNNPTDKTCHGFCHKSSEDHRTNDSSPPMTPTHSIKLLASFRSAAQSNMLITSKMTSSGVEKSKKVHKQIKAQRRSVFMDPDFGLLPLWGFQGLPTLKRQG